MGYRKTKRCRKARKNVSYKRSHTKSALAKVRRAKKALSYAFKALRKAKRRRSRRCY